MTLCFFLQEQEQPSDDDDETGSDREDKDRQRTCESSGLNLMFFTGSAGFRQLLCLTHTPEEPNDKQPLLSKTELLVFFSRNCSDAFL